MQVDNSNIKTENYSSFIVFINKLIHLLIAIKITEGIKFINYTKNADVSQFVAACKNAINVLMLLLDDFREQAQQ